MNDLFIIIAVQTIINILMLAVIGNDVDDIKRLLKERKDNDN